LRYFTEFGKPVFQHITEYFVVRVRCRHEESSCSLSHLLMSILLLYTTYKIHALFALLSMLWCNC